LGLPEAESVGEAAEGLAQDFFRSDGNAEGSEFDDESAAAPGAEGESEIAEERAAAPAAGGEADVPEQGAADLDAGGYEELAAEVVVEPEAGSDSEIAGEGALKAAPDQESSTEQLAGDEIGLLGKMPSVSLSLFRVIEIGLAAALFVLFGLTLWVRQRG
jgi:hypothetical protein